MNPRLLAREWRNNEAARPRIFNEITEAGMWDLFRMDGDRLLARITPADRDRITACGESFGSLNIRPLSFTAEQLAHSGVGMGFVREAHTGLIHMNEDLAA